VSVFNIFLILFFLATGTFVLYSYPKGGDTFMSENKHIGKRIRLFRERRGLTQKQLGELSCIIEATIRKYELGQRNPKPDQTAKIAEALGVTPYALSPIEIETDADVISLILAIDELVGITFDGKKEDKGKIDPKTLTLHIENGFVNDSLAKWGNAKNHLEKMKSSDLHKTQKKEHDILIAEFESEIETTKISLMDSSKIIGKDVKGVSVKINPDYPALKPKQK